MKTVVAEAGLEPAREFTPPRILSPVRLPFRHSAVNYLCGKGLYRNFEEGNVGGEAGGLMPMV